MNDYREIVRHIAEFTRVMEDEPPESLIKLSSIYSSLRRILGNAYEEKDNEQEQTLPKGWN